ncbi:MAG: type VI secretion system membrane subunit TssM [Cellvibrionaceae bacterium]|nr:type VI secretion system membrane subunit TssM [Cellvibrionaceae bacterium]
MRRVVAFFTNRWVIGIIGLLAISLLIWFGANYIKFGEDNATIGGGTRALIIIVIWSFWLAWNISRWVFERKQNDKLLTNMKEAEQEAAVNPDEQRSQEEIQAISNRFREAMDTLRKSRFKSSRGEVSLYQLPWYIIVGPPGSGKSTALVNSGLQFPLANNLGKEALGGVGGTRNCDWWFTNEAVLIDTAGRYTTQDSHRVVDNSAWSGFLNLLKRYRKRRPINGAIVAISLQDLMTQTAEQRSFQAKTIRTRINELQVQLGIRFPVYLTFTKCDLVAGFSEFFDNLSQAEREQVWGLSFAAEASPEVGADLACFVDEFDQLIQRLNQRMLWRVHNERDIQKRSLLQGFPARMEAMKNLVDDFLQQAFAPNNYDVVPMLRGVYFTSATQEGSPIDRMMAAVSANFGLDREALKSQTNRGKSYFLNLLLKEVIFPESELVGVNRKLEKNMLWLRRGAFAGLGLLFLATLLLWFGSVTRNKIYMGQVEDYIAQFRETRKNITVDNRDFDKTLSALEPLNLASQVYDQEQHPWLSNVGLYDGRVDKAADELYANQLDALFLPNLKASLEHQMRTLKGDDESLFDTLKVYLMFFDSERREDRAIQSFMGLHWENQFPNEPSKRAALNAHLGSMLQRENLPESFAPDLASIESARRKLRSLGKAQRLYNRAKNSDLFYAQRDLFAELGSDAATVFTLNRSDPAYTMPVFFTLEGYKSLDFSDESPFISNYSTDSWVFGDEEPEEGISEKDRASLAEEMKNIYLTEYEETWRRFLAKFDLVGLRSTNNAIALLDIMADPSRSPLRRIVELTAENTLLTPKPKSKFDAKGVPIPLGSNTQKLVGAASERLGKPYEPTKVDQRFNKLHRIAQIEEGRPAEIQEYLDAAQAVREYLLEIDGAADGDAASFDAAKNRFSGANDAIRKLRVKAASAPSPVNRWLSDIADDTWSIVVARAQKHVNLQWREQVRSVYNRSIANRYPMVKGKSSEVAASEFSAFFGPSGVEQSFVNEYVSPFVDTKRWQAKTLDGRQLSFSKSSLTQFRRASNIRAAFFRSGGSASMRFRAVPTKLDSGVRIFNLEIGDSRITYSHGPPSPKDIVWTAGEDSRARVIFEDLNDTIHRAHYEGDWAWLRLLDASEVKTASNRGVRLVTFNKNGRSATYRMTASTSINPFDRGLLSNYRVGESL